MKYPLMTSPFSGHLLMLDAAGFPLPPCEAAAGSSAAGCALPALCCRQGCAVAEALKAGMLVSLVLEKEAGKEKR